MTNHNELNKQIQKLHRLTVWSRWLLVLGCWLCLGTISIWSLRSEIVLWQQYFTWTAVRYAIIYNRLPAFCLAFCIGITAAVLVWQSLNIVRGLSAKEKYRLAQQVQKIRLAGPSHPLWKWVCKP
ncbi:MAG: hypothetical protein ACFB4I_01525 [Cyanophyceae cyanobacterium]